MATLRKLRRALRERGADLKNLLIDNRYDIQRDSNNDLVITDTESGSTYKFKEDGTFESAAVGTEVLSHDGVVNVKDFGAVGDGETDDSEAFRQAQGADDEFRVVYVPKGDYFLDEASVLTNNTYWRGEGWPNGTRIICGDPQDRRAIFISDNTDGILQNVSFRHIEFDCSEGWDSYGYDPSLKHVYIHEGDDIDHSYCYVHDTPATGIGLDDLRRSRVMFNRVDRAGTAGEENGSNGIGYGVGRGDYVKNWTVGNVVKDTQGESWGITLEGVGATERGHVVAFNHVDGGFGGIGIDDSEVIAVGGNTVMGTTEYGIYVGAIDQNPPEHVGVANNIVYADPTTENEMQRGGLIFPAHGTPRGSTTASDPRPVDCHAWNNTVVNATKINEGIRCTMGGVGKNGSANPSGGGDWGGYQVPGVPVKWDDGGTPKLSRYVDGQWLEQTLTSQRTVLEDFEGDLSAYGGDTGQFAVNSNSPVFEGSQSLKGTAASGAGNGIASTSVGTISTGDTLRYSVQLSDAADFNVTYFMVQSETASPDGYMFGLNASNDWFALLKRVGGSFGYIGGQNRARVDFDLGSYVGEQLDVEVRCQPEHRFHAVLSTGDGEQIGQVIAQDGDDNFSSGGIGFTARNTDGTASTQVWDNVRLD